jgi:tyrosine-protein kinase Etk/Wzc
MEDFKKDKQNQEINIREILIKYAKKWYIFAIAIVVCVILGFIYIKFTPAKYQTYSTILIRTEDSNPMSGFLSGSNMSDLLAPQKAVDNEIEVIKSKTIIQQMIDELGIQTTVYKKKNLKYDEIYGQDAMSVIYPKDFYENLQGAFQVIIEHQSDGTYHLSFKYKKNYSRSQTEKEKVTVTSLSKPVKTQWGSFIFIEHQPNEEPYKIKMETDPMPVLVERYSQLITAGLISKKTDAVKIAITYPQTNKSKDIINKIVELYNRDALTDKNRMSMQIATFINERLVLIAKELTEVEDNVEKYKKEHHLADITSQSKLFIETAGEYEKQMAEVEIQIGLASFVENYVQDPRNTEALIPGNTGIEDEALSKVIEAYNAQLLDYLRIKRSTNEENPILAQQRDQILLTKKNIAQTVKNVKSSLEIMRKDLASKNQQFTDKIGNVPTVERQYVEIARQQQVKQQLYLFLLQKREETELNLASSTNIAKIIDPAYTELAPVSPKKTIILFFAFAAGCLLALVYLYIYDIVNNKITSKKELTSLTEIPILGQIPFHKNQGHIVMKEGAQGVITEMFRMVRTNIKFILKKKEDKVIIITSSVAGEGKSFFSTNLALSLAMINKKVLLIGLDIRKPVLPQYLDIHPRYGITSYLVDDAIQIDEIISKQVINNNLDVIVSGPIPPNPSEILTNVRLNELFEQLRTQYDYILVDTAPIGLVSDTFTLEHISDATLYVCHQGITPREYIEALNTLVKENKLNNVSIILNGVDEGQLSHYGHYVKQA